MYKSHALISKKYTCKESPALIYILRFFVRMHALSSYDKRKKVCHFFIPINKKKISIIAAHVLVEVPAYDPSLRLTMRFSHTMEHQRLVHRHQQTVRFRYQELLRLLEGLRFDLSRQAITWAKLARFQSVKLIYWAMTAGDVAYIQTQPPPIQYPLVTCESFIKPNEVVTIKGKKKKISS